MIKEEVILLIAEDDVGHATLIKKNLRRAGISNGIKHFKDGQEILDFLFKRGKGPIRKSGVPYLLLLDIRMPKVDGVEVLKRIKRDEELKKMPVLMLSTTDDPREIANCHSLGCSNYLVKPVDYEQFVEAVRKLGLFLQVIRVPQIDQR
ncbi:response regulator [bacterium]|nr:response regulator [bacterium]